MSERSTLVITFTGKHEAITDAHVVIAIGNTDTIYWKIARSIPDDYFKDVRTPILAERKAEICGFRFQKYIGVVFTKKNTYILVTLVLPKVIYMSIKT
jgi:hypothetical protein